MGGPGSGRKRKPDALKKAQGNPGGRPLNESGPIATLGAPDKPPLSAIASQEWDDIVPQLMQMGVLTQVDGKALAAYCSTYEQWQQAEKMIKKYGLVTQSMGQLRKNPAVGIKSDALKLMKSFLIEFGLTPSSRSKLHLEPQAKEDDPVDALLKRSQSFAGAPALKPN